jgi:lipopolysaccharide transport system ATP-binding protein
MAFIRMEGVTVEFPLYDVSSRSLRNRVLKGGANGRVHTDDAQVVRVRALRDISLDLVDGDRLGLVGANGAGKSTLLKAITGIYEPAIGSIAIGGKVASLLGVGLGIDPDMTGRENVFMQGLILGMSRSEIRRKVKEIQEFADLGDSFELPVRTYSSGMHVRLAFAVSTSIEPEILVIDEVIGAGDQFFMQKAQTRVDKIIADSKILVFASHALEIVRKFCNKGVLLREGRIVASGPMDEVIEAYRGTN